MVLNKKLHNIMLSQMKKKTTGNLSVKGELPKNKNYLFVGNHLGIEDIPTLAQAIKVHSYTLVAYEDRRNTDGIGLCINGCVWVHRASKKNRQKAFNKIIKLLNNNENVAMYPEASWNISPNLLMLPMNYGCIRMALGSNVPIVPVVSHWGRNGRKSVIGEAFYPTKDLKESISILRDRMATIVFSQIEEEMHSLFLKGQANSEIIDGREYYYVSRNSISEHYLEEYIDDLYNKWGRAKKNKVRVRLSESAFIFTPKGDAHKFFQTFNSISTIINGERVYKRISSEKNGYFNGEYSRFFGGGYNEYAKD